jgi:hypothetical protein
LKLKTNLIEFMRLNPFFFFKLIFFIFFNCFAYWC